VSDLFRLWFAIGLIVAAIFMFRGYADQPCATALTCLVPSFYLALKPLLIFGGVIALLTGMIGTLTWMVRSRRR
jgi:hypothetical protein